MSDASPSTGDTFPMTHGILSIMLGVARPPALVEISRKLFLSEIGAVGIYWDRFGSFAERIAR